MKKLIFLLCCCSFPFAINAQTTINGTITDANNEALPGVTVKSVTNGTGTVTDGNGNFSLTVDNTPPFDISISSVGYQEQIVSVTTDGQSISASLEEENNQLQEIVVSASRTPERVFESPVSIERVGQEDIRQTAAANYYDGLENLKGVDVNTNSLTFKSVNTRGFATFANYRFVQLVDGMDNSSPALNFVIGNLLGMNELDVESIELLPGASSALYGANAFNGILFMNSKSPFKHQGVSAYARGGILSQDPDSEGFGDMGIRLGHAFSDRFAAKASVSYLKGQEWPASDNRDYATGANSRAETLSNYDGLNIYGDEVGTTLNFDALAGTPAGTFGSARVTRTGYQESDLMDYDAESLKADVALHYKPTGGDLEFIYNGKIGKGNTIYQGANRYSIKNFSLAQHKLEARSDNFFIRGYLTTEDAGDSYDSRFTAININNSWKGNQQWFTDYATGYLGAITGMIPGVPPGDAATAHSVARQNADTGRLMPGTPAFDSALATITSDPSLLTGSQFVDESKLSHVDANYNFKNQIDFADVQIGGSWRKYGLNSRGTIFTDTDGQIDYDEYGLYTQIQKKFAQDKLKFTGSIRYDKAQNFDGNVSPRLSMVFSPDEQKNHNIRASYQTGFRNPTTQDQYIGLDAGQAILVGSAPDNLDRYTSRPIGNSMTAQALGFGSTVQLSGRLAYENAFTLSSLQAFGASAAAGAPNPGLLQQATPGLVQPEKIAAFELGYRSALGRNTFFDISGYFNNYEDFISTETVIVPNYGKTDFSDINPAVMQPNAIIAVANGDFTPFQVYTNSTADIESYGVTMGIDTKFGSNYDFGFNYTWADFNFDQSLNPDFEPSFNTPEHKFKASLMNDEIFKNTGFGINWRWNDSYLWQSSFVDTTIDARSVVDAQLNYTVESMKSTFKLGAANLFDHKYESVPGSGTLGAQYFLGWTYNN